MVSTSEQQPSPDPGHQLRRTPHSHMTSLPADTGVGGWCGRWEWPVPGWVLLAKAKPGLRITTWRPVRAEGARTLPPETPRVGGRLEDKHRGAGGHSLTCEPLPPAWAAGLVGLGEKQWGGCLSLSLDFDDIVSENPRGPWETRVCA